MLILAFESSAKPASVAVFKQDERNNADNGKLLGQYFQNNGFSHSRTLLAMAESLLCGLDFKPEDISLIAVASGPGSFTGVRIGVSAAKGLAFGLDVPVCGVSTLEAMARQTSGADEDMLICPVMDARRRQVYNALFRWENGALVRLREDRAISIEDLFTDISSFDKPWMPVGDGTELVLSVLTDGRAHRPAPTAINPNPLTKHQTAYGVALAALHVEPVSAIQLEPVYLRPSQAERNLTSGGGR